MLLIRIIGKKKIEIVIISKISFYEKVSVMYLLFNINIQLREIINENKILLYMTQYQRKYTYQLEWSNQQL